MAMTATIGRKRRQWLLWPLLLVALTLALLSVRERLDNSHVALAFLLLVLGASATGGRALGFTMVGASFLAFNIGFLPPYGTLVINNPLDWIVLLAFVVTSAVAAQLLYRANTVATVANDRASEVERLAMLGAETLGAPDAGTALTAIARVIREAIGVELCEIYHRASDGSIVRLAFASHGPADGDTLIAPDSVLSWLEETRHSAMQLADGTLRLAFDDDLATPLGTHAAVDANALRSVNAVIAQSQREPARALLFPLLVRDSTVGLLRIASNNGVVLSSEQARMLIALAYYAALALDRGRLVEHAERIESERRVEALRNALLTAVSHDLRTPLTTIKGIAHELQHGAPRTRASVIEAEADRLALLIDDFLNLSRIHAGAVVPDIAVNTIDELFAAALQQVGGVLPREKIETELPRDDVLPAHFDFSATVRVLVNLLENAARYASTAEPIVLRAARHHAEIRVSVLDRGPGIAFADQERAFEPFFRARGTSPDVRGSGLGLSIARGLAEAQGGTVAYHARAGGGSEFVLTIPAAIMPIATLA